MNGKIYFFEPDARLAGRLIDYWMSHGMAQYSFSYYSDVSKLSEAASAVPDLWILDRSITQSGVRIPAGNILWWTDSPEDTGAAFKYRSAEVLMHTILGQLHGAEAHGHTEGAQVISLYSPVRQRLQTAFGIQLAHLLARNGRILYLNLEGYSGFERLLSGPFSKDISDFIYYVTQSSENISLITQNFTHRLGEADMIPPVLNPRNLQEITEEMWIHMLQEVRTCGLYDYIVLDISDFVQGIFSILEESRFIFSPMSSDAAAMAKWDQYRSILEESGREDILKRTSMLQIHTELLPAFTLEPCFTESWSEQVSRAAEEAGLI